MLESVCTTIDFKKVRIIATVGPVSNSVDMLRKLIREGTDCFRLNFSHGDGASMQPVIDNIHEAEKLEGVYIPILADIQGPKIRIGILPNEGINLHEGNEFTITTRDVEGSETIVNTPYVQLPNDIRTGSRILLSDGTIELKAEEIEDRDVKCRIIHGGRLYSHKGINLPDTRLSVETLTEKDRTDLQFASSAGVDLVAISFVRSAHDIVRAQTILDNTDMPIIAKLERPEALENLDEILEISDGVMVARGDLGVEIEFEKVPNLQKKILRKAASRGKWAVVATQMLGSMVLNSRPTRAEVSDVANAVIDGADAVMLSEETATGKNPVTAVEAMKKISSEAACDVQPIERMGDDIQSFSAAASGAAVSAAHRLKAKAIVSLAGSGTTALMLSKWKPEIPIIALASKLPVLRRMNLLRGVIPLFIDGHMEMEDQLKNVDEFLIRNNWAEPGDTTIIVAAIPLGEKKETNTIRFHRVRQMY